ncbi:hypothetical protein K7G19_19850 [Cupriavidus sp. DB3]|uniref:hypothetical protein n=1 Tax=Cupriavidus sp. DB3 TaxID=2873259 RepID=UPI001CF1EE13|nr:hypothetical protein [Cupriavidus sp. DB3]MCA7085847.1 hypothetical protein [Cupriavidus sp. DB3]
MYLLQQTVPVEAVPALVAGVGYVGQIATDPDTDDVYVNFGGQWTKLVAGNGEPVQMTVTSAQITDATSVGRAVLTAADQAAARTAIGAGTSNLAIGTTATTAMAGNKVPTNTQRGGVLQQAAIANVAAAPTQGDFNGLLTALRAAGILASA